MPTEDEVVRAFQGRDVRSNGKRDPFYAFMAANSDIAPYLLPLVPEYGSWDDMFTLASQQPYLKRAVFTLAAIQIVADEKNLGTRPLSQIGKWAPREGKAFGHLAKEFARYLVGPVPPNVNHSQIMASYRKRMSRLNAALKTVEVYECAGRWDEIDPSSVPVSAFNIKLAAYLNEDYNLELREPENVKRMKCRENFLNFLHEDKPAPKTTPADRYEAVRTVYREWEQGGWRV
jgi:hypothetical protein